MAALRTALDSFFDRDSVLAAFAPFPADVQYEVKEEMWLLAGEDIDPANPQPHDRENAEDWFGRVIRNEVQVPGEEGPHR